MKVLLKIRGKRRIEQDTVIVKKLVLNLVVSFDKNL